MKELLWGPMLGPVHLATLALGAAMIVGLYFLLKNRSAAVQTAVLGVLSFSGLAAVIFNLAVCSRWGQSPWEYLPLHLCSINAILLPVAVFSRSRVLGNMLLLWSLGALSAILVNRPDYDLGSDVFFFYFFPHVLEFGIPILLFKLGLVKKELKYIFSTLALTLGIYLFIHLCNLGINGLHLHNGAGELICVNYMYSLRPEFPVLEIFWKILPFKFFYMLTLFPIIAVYLLAVYAPQLLRRLRRSAQ